MIRSGGVSGQMSSVLDRLVEHMEDNAFCVRVWSLRPFILQYCW